LWIRERTGGAEVGIEYVDLAGPEVGRVQVVAEPVETDGETLEDRARFHVQVVDLSSCDGPVRRLPTGDGAVFGREEEEVAIKLAVAVVVVEDGAGRSPLGTRRAPGRRRDGYPQRQLHAVAAVERRNPHAVIRNPHRAGPARRDAPGIYQVGVGELGLAWNVGVQVGLPERG